MKGHSIVRTCLRPQSGTFNFDLLYQKQPCRVVLRKKCSENMQQIYKRSPMLKCDFNKEGYFCFMLNSSCSEVYFKPSKHLWWSVLTKVVNDLSESQCTLTLRLYIWLIYVSKISKQFLNLFIVAMKIKIQEKHQWKFC